ncbi:2-(3-amino-3-carboxypropyl)histidine synthase subunit 2 [Anastrepha obliqua]|uniref:2-(3-amino-3-carboxypropyl)histidine synthase subunit 2 n=1 Tax=Anastrepha obliqua TaxID=95512 RepID=UPI0024093AF7|nr:2-(3-amino-3-carboxypropyl)histidine synthase subunit 2 [Anastrepha obliqua]
MSTSSFYTSAEEAIERQADIEQDEVTPPLEQVWNGTLLKICWGWIRQNGYKRVCLQFPDHYLPHSNEISDSLKALFKPEGGATDIKFFVLADTSYGSCCVDEIAAGHVEADSLIHFGNACRSRVSRLPVLYMYPQYPFDMKNFMDNLSVITDSVKGKVVFIYLDIGYHHLLDKRVDEAEEDSLCYKLKEVLPCKDLFIEAYPPAEDAAVEQKQPSEPFCLFIGAENARFSNLSITTHASQWFIYKPASNTILEKNPLTAQYIRRRYYYIEKCKDAQTLGLIVATLTAEGYLKIVSRLQEMAKARGIKTQIISVGRINPAKLANFLEIDCFVLIGCPFNNIYNSKEYYKPIVSVFEAEMALNPAWYMKYPEAYVTDFKKLLPEGEKFLAFNSADLQEQDVSLVSGRVRANNAESVEDEGAGALSEQYQTVTGTEKMGLMINNTGLTFEDRTWKGLDPALGCTEPAKLEKGLSGIPTNYTHD